MFYIHQFIISESKLGAVVQNSLGITVIENEKLKNFLFYLDENGKNNFFDEDLALFFGREEFEDVINFLMESSIIYDKKEMKGNFNNIGIYSNNQNFKDCFEFVGDDRFKFVDDYIKFENYDLVVLFFNPFSLIKYNQLVDYVFDKNIPCIFSFFYASKFYISNLYKKELYSPCPKCFFYNLEASIRAYGKISDELSFQTIVDMIYAQNPLFEVEAKLNKKEIFFLVSEILKMISQNVNISGKKVVEVDLNGNVSYDVPVHFELCDCFEK
ncbi:MAG: McbB family protein [Peptoniphilaceae bacterium]|uniref:McbB family protein n=1 Tax=Bacteria TaxID=2 RepID=UPI002A7575DE|nr:McbB family protein [Parvimonas sp.]MDD7764436.1 McbB family protein [Peptoniphilaceae bacterium]MDY3051284.1 McbB family protein [Parvimonas sp.]MDY5795630.1 McbB family protein [Fusobacterium gastrosuis]